MCGGGLQLDEVCVLGDWRDGLTCTLKRCVHCERQRERPNEYCIVVACTLIKCEPCVRERERERVNIVILWCTPRRSVCTVRDTVKECDGV